MAQRDFNALNYMSGLGNNTSDGFIENSIRVNGDEAAKLRKETNYADGFLEMLIKTAGEGHAQFLRKVPLVKGTMNITFTRIDPISEGTELLEGKTPAGDEITATTVTGTLRQYGKIMYSTDRAAVVNRIDIMEKIVEYLPQSAKYTMDTIAKNALHEQAGIRAYATKMAYSDESGITVSKTANKISEITSDMGFNFWDIHNIRSTMVLMGALEDGSEVTCVISQSGRESFIRDPWFYITLAKNGKIDMYNTTGIPSILGITFKVLPRTKKYAAGELVKEIPGASADVASNTAGVALDTALLIANDAGVRLDLISAKAGGMGPAFYRVGLIPTKDDGLAQRELAGYKFWMGTIIHTPQRVGVYYFASINNTPTTTIARNLNFLPMKQLGYFNATNATKAADVVAAVKARATEIVLNYLGIVNADSITIGTVKNRQSGAELADSDISNAVWAYGMSPAIDLDFEVTSTTGGLSGKAVLHAVLQIDNGFQSGMKDFVEPTTVPNPKK
jgi:N4-gp56 family major capsid protein